MARVQRLNIKRLAKRLKEVRETDSLNELTIPVCTCEPISDGCKCGCIEWERTMRVRSDKELEPRCLAFMPDVGDYYQISRPPDADLHYCEIPFRVWAKCEGKKVKILQVEQDNNPDFFWCWCDVSHLTKDSGDQYWFPNDGLLESR